MTQIGFNKADKAGRKQIEDGGRSFKIVVVGDGSVGKTSLLVAYTSNQFSEVHVPTVFDNYVMQVIINGMPYEMTLFDTAGQDINQGIFVIALKDADAVILCYDVTNEDSLQNIDVKWMKFVNKHVPSAKCVLAGTKMDMLDEPCAGKNLVKDASVARLQKKHKQIVTTIKCSAKTQKNVADVFKASLLALLKPEKKESGSGCNLL